MDEIEPYYQTVKRLADESGVTIAYLCERSGINQSVVSRARHGINYMTYPVAEKLLNALKEYLLEFGAMREEAMKEKQLADEERAAFRKLAALSKKASGR